MKIGAKLECLRQEHALTQTRLARILGGDQPTLSKILAGEPGRNLNRAQYLKAARHFSVTVESLLDDDMELERVTEDDRAVTRLVRLLGVEESLRRLTLPDCRVQGPRETRLPWGQMGSRGDEADGPHGDETERRKIEG